MLDWNIDSDGSEYKCQCGIHASNGVMMCAINVEAEEEFFQSHHAST